MPSVSSKVLLKDGQDASALALGRGRQVAADKRKQSMVSIEGPSGIQEAAQDSPSAADGIYVGFDHGFSIGDAEELVDDVCGSASRQCLFRDRPSSCK